MKKILSFFVLIMSICLTSCVNDDSVEEHIASKSNQYGFTHDNNGDSKDDKKN